MRVAERDSVDRRVRPGERIPRAIWGRAANSEVPMSEADAHILDLNDPREAEPIHQLRRVVVAGHGIGGSVRAEELEHERIGMVANMEDAIRIGHRGEDEGRQLAPEAGQMRVPDDDHPRRHSARPSTRRLLHGATPKPNEPDLTRRVLHPMRPGTVELAFVRLWCHGVQPAARIAISPRGPVSVARCGTLSHMTHEVTRRHRSFRFSEHTLERLDARAHEIRETRTGLAERYLEEGLRMDEHPGIGFADGPAGRRAVLLGTGLDVWEIVATIRQNSGSPEAAAAYLELPTGPVRSATRYYAAFPDEIDDILERQTAIAERERSAAERERTIFR